MRLSLFLCLWTVSPLFGWAQHSQNVSSAIDEVLVFTRGAQITRTATVTLPAGTSDVVFAGLTHGMLPNQVQAEVGGDAIVLGVTRRENFLEPPEQRAAVQVLRQRIRQVQDSVALEIALRDVYQEEEAMLLANRAIGGSENGVSIEALKEATTFFRERLREVKTEQLRSQQEIRRLEEIQQALNRQLGELQGTLRQQATSEVTVTVQAERATTTTVTLRYMTFEAGWYPYYDVRVRDIDSPVALSYKAYVYQSTDADWENVRLTLSTGNPAQSARQPELQPWRIDLARNAIRAGRGQASRYQMGVRQSNPTYVEGRILDAESGEPLPGANVRIVETGEGMVTDGTGAYRFAVAGGKTLEASFIGYQSVSAPIQSPHIDFYLAPSTVALDEVVVQYERPLRGASAIANLPPPPPVELSVNTTTVEFAITVPYTIASDNQPVSVAVQQLDVPASYTYYAAPKRDGDAFLTARIAGWESYNLLSGDANLFLGDAFVGTSQLDLANVDDTLTVSLGRDKGVVVERTQRRDFERRTFFRDKRVEQFAYDIEVRNTKSVPITIIIEDHVPITTDAALDVRVDADDAAQYNEETGILTWRLTLPPAQRDVVSFSYELRYPRDRTVVGH